MNGLVNVAWAVMCIGGAGAFLLILIADHAEIGRRLRQAGHILAEAGPWLAAALKRKVRGEFAAPSRAHPAAKARRRCACWGCTRRVEHIGPREWECWFAMEQPARAPGRES